VTSVSSSFSKDKELGELKRELQAALKKIPPLEIKDVIAPYSEPMYLGLTSRPRGVMLLWAVDATDQENPEAYFAGVSCHSTWDGLQNRMRINSIDGLTPDPSKTFKFSFLVVG
jgi:hypothetical protein